MPGQALPLEGGGTPGGQVQRFGAFAGEGPAVGAAGVDAGPRDSGAGHETVRVGGQQRAELDEDAQAVLRAGVYGGLGGAGSETHAAPVMVEMGHLLAARAVGEALGSKALRRDPAD